MTRPAYYNDIDPHCAQWLRNLIDMDAIPYGEVDTRSVHEITPGDLEGFGQVHLFAGIGGFALGARLAGWPDGLPLWTGGYPCQPFSEAGKRKATDDERHLWPEFHRLIDSCRPPVVLAENVRNHVRLGLDAVLHDLEASGYATRPGIIPCAAVGAPILRERVWICAVAQSDSLGRHGWQDLPGWNDAEWAPPRRQEVPGRVAMALSGAASPWADAVKMDGPDNRYRDAPAGIPALGHGFPTRVDEIRAYGNAINPWVAAAILEGLLDVLHPEFTG